MDEAELKEWTANHMPWDQMPGEPELWYRRFLVYLNLGVTRTLKRTARVVGEQIKGKPMGWSDCWKAEKDRWHWRERALAWDVHQRDLLALSERNVRVALRARRLARMEEYIDTVCEVIDNAHITEAEEGQAREWLPQMRVFLRDLLVAEREEFAQDDYGRDDLHAGLTITADDLRAAQRELEARTGMSFREAMLAASRAEAAASPRPAAGDRAEEGQPRAEVRGLYVCLGPDPALMIDVAVLRGVKAATGLPFHRLLDTTREKFSRMLRRERRFGRPVKLLHMATHATPEGLEFADAVVDGNWLSERLLGVEVMLLASCACEGLGDWLGVVPYVVSLSEEITHEDAAALAEAFWHGIGLGMAPGAALDEALTHCPPVVGEYVVRHW